MNRWLRWALYGVGLIAVALGAGVFAGTLLADQRMQRKVAVTVTAVPLPEDPARLSHGRYLYESRGCAECHGADGGGRLFINEPPYRLSGPQISPGPQSVTAGYAVEDWVRAIRHGVGRGQRPLWVMPSEDYNRMSDDDLGALIAWCRQFPAVRGLPAVREVPLPVRVLYGFGVIPDAATTIDHRLPPHPAVAAGNTVEYGRYVAQMCVGCHGSGFSGGPVPGGSPDWPAAANLTSGNGSVMGRYADVKAFTAMMRGGKRADGSAIRAMPFESLARMGDTDLGALHTYLKTLPPRPAGSR